MAGEIRATRYDDAPADFYRAIELRPGYPWAIARREEILAQ